MPEVVTRPEKPGHPVPSEVPLPVVPEEPLEARGLASALPCANCGTALAGPYCSRCGQHDQDYHRSLWRFFSDFLDNTFCWDNRFLLTAKPLLRRPGFLTQEFMAGRRARYVHPLRLFLFTSAVCLALIGFINHHLENAPKMLHAPVGSTTKEASKHARASGDVEEEKAVAPADKTSDGSNADDADDDTKAVPAASAAPSTRGSPAGARAAAPSESLAAKIQAVLATNTGKHAGAAAAGSPAALPDGAVGPPAPPAAGESESTGADTRENTRRQIRAALRDAGALRSARPPESAGKEGAVRPGGFDADAINAKIDAALAKGNAALAKGDAALANADRLRAQKIGRLVGRSFDSEKAGRIAEAISQGVEKKLSWVALALLPVFALLLRAVYWREDSYYFTHFVYSLHYHTFLFLFWAAYACAGVVAAFLPLQGLWSFLLGWCLLLPGWYLFVSLRRMYGESSRRTVAKVMVLGVLHLLAILIGVASVGAMAFFSAQR